MLTVGDKTVISGLRW